MTIAVINLARSRDRRDLIEANFARLGLNFEFFTGIDAWRGEHVRFFQYNATTVGSDFHRPLSAGEIGCFASHYLLWQRCMEAREPLVIMEDDVVIDDGFVRALETAIELLPTFPLIRLGLTEEGAGTAPILPLPGFELVFLGADSWGAQCYIVSDIAAKALFEHAAVWSMPVDVYMNRRLIHGIGDYGLRPYFVRHADQAAYPSVIGDERYATGQQDQASKVESLLKRFIAERGPKPNR